MHTVLRCASTCFINPQIIMTTACICPEYKLEGEPLLPTNIFPTRNYAGATWRLAVRSNMALTFGCGSAKSWATSSPCSHLRSRNVPATVREPMH